MKVKHAKVGLHPDGGGLYLQVTAGQDDRAQQELGVSLRPKMVTSAAWGSDRFIRTVLVKPANELAECRKLRDAGKGPIETRNSERAEQKAPAATLTATAIFMDPLPRRFSWETLAALYTFAFTPNVNM